MQTTLSKNKTSSEITGQNSKALKGVEGVMSLSKTGLTVKQRISELRKMRGSADAVDVKKLLSFLQSGEKPEGISSSQYRWLADESMTVLRLSSYDRRALTGGFIQLYQNEEQDIVVRDYALQHLGHLRDC